MPHTIPFMNWKALRKFYWQTSYKQWEFLLLLITSPYTWGGSSKPPGKWFTHLVFQDFAQRDKQRNFSSLYVCKIQETWEKGEEDGIVFIGFILAVCVIWSKSKVQMKPFYYYSPCKIGGSWMQYLEGENKWRTL